MSMRRPDNRDMHRRSPMDVERLKGNMRMDRKPNATRISDPSHPLGKRKEIDNVMRKARQQPANEYWDKKLLEAEEKDPNRWKHTGFKKMYVNGSTGSPIQRKSRSPFRKTPVSPRSMRHIPPSPMRRRTPERYRERPKSPPMMRYAGSRKSPPRLEMKGKEMYRSKRPMSPPPKARTPSISSCSDSQCSGCSSDDDHRIVDKRSQRVNRHGPVNRIHRPMSPDEINHLSKKNKIREMSPKRHHLKRPASPLAEKRREIVSPPAKKRDKARTRIKIEGEKRRHRSPSSGSDDSKSSASEDSFAALTATTRITLNERFGKMAQWNNDRKYDMSNMKITKKSDGGDRSAVMIQEQNIREASPMRKSPQYTKGEGHYPEELMQFASAQALGLSAWNDDVRVRYDYYKSKGYLRDLTIQDYIKWEEWWYRYQEWLQQERYFEHLERTMMRRRRKKIPIQQRLN